MLAQSHPAAALVASAIYISLISFAASTCSRIPNYLDYERQEIISGGFAQAFSCRRHGQPMEQTWTPLAGRQFGEGNILDARLSEELVSFGSALPSHLRGRVRMGEPSLDDSNVKVAVRVRPMNRRGEWWWFTPMEIDAHCGHRQSDRCDAGTTCVERLNKAY